MRPKYTNNNVITEGEFFILPHYNVALAKDVLTNWKRWEELEKGLTILKGSVSLTSQALTERHRKTGQHEKSIMKCCLGLQDSILLITSVRRGKV